MSQLWWSGAEISGSETGLKIEGVSVRELAAKTGTPVYLYSGQAVRRRLGELRAAMQASGRPHIIHFAIKANRHPDFLAVIRSEGDIRIDASSPREVALALECGFARHELSVTVSMPSNEDLRAFAGFGVHVNLDTFSAIRRYAAVAPRGAAIGLRIDPGVSMGYGDNPKLSYGLSKFGFSWERIPDAVALARDLGLTVDMLHFHAGWGFQQNSAPAYESILAAVAPLARSIPSIRTVNVGGGLCWRQTALDSPLALATWSALLKKHLGSLDVAIACESGTYIAAAAGILVAEVNTVEDRLGHTWVGLNAGHNVNVYAAHYNIPQEIIHVERPAAPPAHSYVVAGNINEANDVFARAVSLPEIKEGDLVAFFPAGAYGASMASDHCLKGLPRELLVGAPARA